MPSHLPHLDTESALLMYLAGELPAEDRAGVERMLAGDARLRAQLEELRAAYGGAAAALRTADQAERLATSPGTAARRVGLAVRSWHARRLGEPRAEAPRRGLRFPWWCYPAASVAAILVAALSWWGMNSDGIKRLEPWPAAAEMLRNAEQAAEDAEPVQAGSPLERFADLRDEQDAVLDDAEDELYAMTERSADDAGGLFWLGGDTNEQ